MHLLLDVERRRVDDQVAPILHILAAPDQLRVQVAVTPFVGDAHRVSLLLVEHRLILRGGDIAPFGLVVGKSCDRFAGGVLAHVFIPLYLKDRCHEPFLR